MKYLILLVLFISQEVFSIPEGTNHFQEWQNHALPFYEEMSHDFFKNAQGMTIHFKKLGRPENKKTLVIIPGQSEAAIKYAEVIYDLKDEGFNFYVLDHQGQGESDRLLFDHQKSHVRFFKDYVNDLNQWVEEIIVPENKDQELYLLAHSMGGAISIYSLIDLQKYFKKAIFLAPMLEINTRPYSEFVARLYASFLVKIGRGPYYAPTKGPYVPVRDTFEKNVFTHSQNRFEMMKFVRIQWPEQVVAGPTARWVNESLKATHYIDRLAPKIKIPIKLLQAEADLIVKLRRQTSFCSKAVECELILMPQSGHEILMEKDETRNKAMEIIRNFLN
ncbi:MAG: alpha/beta fold hydrolase [Bacteriovoracaceae bacterium]